MDISIEYKSPVVPSVLFEGEIEKSVIVPYIEQYAARFFKAQEGIKDLSSVHRVKQKNMITDLDWQRREKDKYIKFEYIYRVVMKKARKKDGQTQQMAYTITFDKKLTSKQCKKTKIHYEEMTLAGEPILYYLRMDLGDLITKARRHVK